MLLTTVGSFIWFTWAPLTLRSHEEQRYGTEKTRRQTKEKRSGSDERQKIRREEREARIENAKSEVKAVSKKARKYAKKQA